MPINLSLNSRPEIPNYGFSEAFLRGFQLMENIKNARIKQQLERSRLALEQDRINKTAANQRAQIESTERLAREELDLKESQLVSVAEIPGGADLLTSSGYDPNVVGSSTSRPVFVRGGSGVPTLAPSAASPAAARAASRNLPRVSAEFAIEARRLERERPGELQRLNKELALREREADIAEGRANALNTQALTQARQAAALSGRAERELEVASLGIEEANKQKAAAKEARNTARGFERLLVSGQDLEDPHRGLFINGGFLSKVPGKKYQEDTDKAVDFSKRALGIIERAIEKSDSDETGYGDAALESAQLLITRVDGLLKASRRGSINFSKEEVEEMRQRLERAKSIIALRTRKTPREVLDARIISSLSELLENGLDRDDLGNVNLKDFYSGPTSNK